MARAELTNEALRGITVTVKIKKKRFFDLCLWIGCQLIKPGAMIAGLGYEESEGELEPLH